MSKQQSKNTFVLGLALGVAIISTIAFLSLWLGGRGSFSLASLPNIFQINTVVNSNAGGGLAPITADDHIRGNPKAAITLVEYSDFECPFCGRLHPTMQQLLSEYDGQIRLVYRHFPLNSIHPNAQKAAEASECAAEQGKFWEYHDLLFANQQSLGTASLKIYAGQLGLGQNQFDRCLDSSKYAVKVSADQQDGQINGVTGTPGTFVNGQLVKGAVPITTFQQIIQDLLN